MKKYAAFLPLLLTASLTLPATAVPEVRISAEGTVRASGSPLFFAGEDLNQVTDPQRVNPLNGVSEVSFPLVCPGEYTPQYSTGQDIWTPLDNPIQHPATGTVSFTRVYFGTPPVDYRLVRRFSTEFDVVIANPGSSDLTGIAASLTGNTAGAFVLDTTDTADSLPPGGNTTLRISFSPGDASAHTAALQIAGNAAGSPFLLLLNGKAVPDPISFCGGGIFSPEPDPDAPPPGFALYGVKATPPGPGTPVRLSGKISGGVPNGEVVLEFSRDLNSGTWDLLEFIQLDPQGRAIFGEPVPLAVPGSSNFTRCFFRATPFE